MVFTLIKSKGWVKQTAHEPAKPPSYHLEILPFLFNAMLIDMEGIYFWNSQITSQGK